MSFKYLLLKTLLRNVNLIISGFRSWILNTGSVCIELRISREKLDTGYLLKSQSWIHNTSLDQLKIVNWKTHKSISKALNQIKSTMDGRDGFKLKCPGLKFPKVYVGWCVHLRIMAWRQYTVDPVSILDAQFS